ncbi:MAG: DUF3619 family protein [Betaproteobacteria bacterium]|nr:DUF3619 family protein [Betaproteobacteria bacterium]
MNELKFGENIRKALDETAARLDAPRAQRLRSARERALARQKIASAPVAGLAWAGNAIGLFGGPTGFSLRVLVPAAVLVFGLVAIWGWQQNARVAEVEEIDVQLLTDELPLEAYLDKGFEAWLKKRSSY